MAQATHPLASPTTATSPGGVPSVLLASCKASICVLKNQQWEPFADSIVFRLQLARHNQGGFTLLAVDDKEIAVKLKIVLRYNTVFKLLKNNFFSLLDNGITVWGFEIAGQASEGQTFAIVVKNSLASLKESNIAPSPRLAPVAQPALPKLELKGDQQMFLNNICSTLSDAINRGNEQFASELARQLATHKVLVRVKLEEPEKDEFSMLTKDNKINLKVQVEDKESAGVHFRLNIAPQTTINQLRMMVQIKYNFPVEIQRWIIGKRIPKSNETLSDCGIKESGHTLFLYLTSPKAEPIAEQPPEWRNREERPRPAAVNRANSDSSLENAHAEQQGQRILQQENLPAFGLMRDVMQSMPNLPLAEVRQPEPVAGWTCPQCTYLNAPTRPGCEMCSAGRPANYQVPQDYMPDQREKSRLDRERSGEILIQEEVLDYEDQPVAHH